MKVGAFDKFITEEGRCQVNLGSAQECETCWMSCCVALTGSLNLSEPELPPSASGSLHCDTMGLNPVIQVNKHA